MGRIKKTGLDIYSSVLKRYINQKQKNKYINHKDDIDIIPLTDEEQREIDQFYIENYGEKIDYRYHEIYKSMSGKFDVTFFPDDLYFSLFEPYMNSREYICKAVEDKSLLYKILRASGVQMPKMLVSNVRGIYQDEESNILSLEKITEILSQYKEVFVKPTIDTCGGEGCKVIENKNGISRKQFKEICKEYHQNFIIQEVCKNHESVGRIYPYSINTFRVVTYIFDGEVKCSKGIMRIGQNGSRIDNASSGGMYIGIRNDGTLMDCAKLDFSNKSNMYEHPDTGIVFEGYKIEKYPAVMEKAIALHQQLPQIGVINWDFAVDEKGEPLLIEANINGGGGVEMIQWTHGEGIFKEDMQGILKWLSYIKKMTKSQYCLKELYPR